MADTSTWHRLTDINDEARTATCSVCGPVAVRKRNSGSQRYQCMTKRKQQQGTSEQKSEWNRARYLRIRDTLSPVERAVVERRNRLRRKYGISPEDYDRMYAEQCGRCLICAGEFPQLVVDHCHNSGAVRGLLCNLCNAGIGMLQDDPTVLAAAAAYVTANRPATVAG